MRIKSLNKHYRALMGAVALFCVPLVSHATPPSMGVIGPIEQEGFFIAECDSFQVLADFTLLITYKEHYNKQGELIFTDYHLWPGATVYYNSTDPSISLLENGGNREIARWYWEYGWVADIGNLFKITLPGQGVVFHQTGRALIAIDTDEIFFSAGPHDYDDENVAALCAAFAG